MSSETFPRSLNPADRNLPGLPGLRGKVPTSSQLAGTHTHCLTLTGKGYWASGVIIGVLVATLRVGGHTLVVHFCKRVRDCQLETTNPKVIVKPCKIVNARRASTIAMYHVSQNRFTTRGRRNIQASLFHFDLYIAYGMYGVRGRKKIVDEEPQKAARIFFATTLL
jgi:hypothetical protein